jgi:riboflavin biosynthesis pyrimidine reductase
LIVTTASGARRLRPQAAAPSVQVVAAAEAAPLSAQEVVDAVCHARPSQVTLIEAGPRLMGDFVAERLLDKLFLTVSPQVAGRDGMSARPGLIAGKRFAPEDPVWGTLVGAKRGGDHLFLHYAFARTW